MSSTAVSVFAPARVNLIGEHTDYAGGLVLPAAVQLGVTVSGPQEQDVIRLRSLAFPDPVELDTDGATSSELSGWSRYAAAVARLLAVRGRPAVGLDATIASTVPIGAGLSSSAALTVAIGLALCRVADFELPPLELARIAQETERLAVGVPCGLMDPAASLLGRRGHALLLDCGTEEHRLVPLPDGLAIVVLDSGVRHALEHSGYATRRAEVERGLEALAGRRSSSVTLAEAMEAARAVDLDAVATRRLRHVVSENERVRACVRALESDDGPDLAALGTLFKAGHESLRDDFEVSTPELDLLVELAYAHGAVAARMMGGGFGGSIVALADSGGASSLAASVQREYAAQTERDGESYVCSAVDGAGDVEPSSAPR